MLPWPYCNVWQSIYHILQTTDVNGEIVWDVPGGGIQVNSVVKVTRTDRGGNSLVDLVIDGVAITLAKQKLAGSRLKRFLPGRDC